MPSPLEPIAIVGAGAVGSFYGAMLARAGRRVTLIGRAAHVQAIEREGLQLQMDGRSQAVPVAATTALEGVRGAALVLLCVKSTDTEATARALAPLLAPDALVLSLQNGVDNVALLARHLRQPVVPAAVYVATQMPSPGVVQHFGGGLLIIGPADAAAAQDAALAARLQAVAALFAQAQVEVRVSGEVMLELWRKLALNCAYNAVSGLAQATYGPMRALPEIQALQRAIAGEVVAVGQAEGQRLALDEVMAGIERIAATMPAQRSSTAQDMARQRPSEIEHINGAIVRRGTAHGIATPVNQALLALVKLVEACR